MKAIELIEKEVTKKKVAEFRVGDTLQIHIRVKEGDKTRVQVFEGICISRRGSGAGASFAVIKESHGDTVEKKFPLYSPTIEEIVVAKKGRVRRAKLYHLRKPKAKTF
ncbi:MAG: 50S ribosomal protein L19 [Omnitrophica bacterium GWA2_52_12]|nr:MAG: 50S ribosomal protein L19 [Omnitrophica bacterium GWA2_52_12]